MLSVLETGVEAKIEKKACFIKNGIVSISNRPEYALSPSMYHTTKNSSSVKLQCETSAEGENSKKYHVVES